MMTHTRATVAEYQAAFRDEAARAYPVVDAFEARIGAAVAQDRLLEAAAVLACPVKKNPPCWQHGRLLYALAIRRLEALDEADAPVRLLDIGTAKGFSALMLQYALVDACLPGVVTTIDVLDPQAAVRRNTIAEVDGFKTLAEILAPFPEAADIVAVCDTGLRWLDRTTGRLHVVFVDGKHTGAVVADESRLIAKRQMPGDVVMWDDVHIADVRAAVEKMTGAYAIEWLQVLPQRAYAIGVRR